MRTGEGRAYIASSKFTSSPSPVVRTLGFGGRRLLSNGLDAGASDARVEIEREEEDWRYGGRKLVESVKAIYVMAKVEKDAVVKYDRGL